MVVEQSKSPCKLAHWHSSACGLVRRTSDLFCMETSSVGGSHPVTATPGAPLAGEIHELKVELGALDKSKKKDAVKKVIAAMTVGKPV